jgi:hypothetical protein
MSDPAPAMSVPDLSLSTGYVRSSTGYVRSGFALSFVDSLFFSRSTPLSIHSSIQAVNNVLSIRC